MVAKKQTAFDGEWKIDFSFLPDAPGQGAGAAVWCGSSGVMARSSSAEQTREGEKAVPSSCSVVLSSRREWVQSKHLRAYES
jgi:hypothetical protein